MQEFTSLIEIFSKGIVQDWISLHEYDNYMFFKVFTNFLRRNFKIHVNIIISLLVQSIIPYTDASFLHPNDP